MPLKFDRSARLTSAQKALDSVFAGQTVDASKPPDGGFVGGYVPGSNSYDPSNLNDLLRKDPFVSMSEEAPRVMTKEETIKKVVTYVGIGLAVLYFFG